MTVQLSIKTQGAELVRQGLQDLEREIPLIGRRGIYDLMLDVRAVMRTPGSTPTYPIKWDSDKQRRYVLAMLREADNLPYRRTNALPRAWDIQKLPNGYRLFNPEQAAVYIYGNYEGQRQSRIHEGRHPIAQETIEIGLQRLPQEIESKISYYAREKGL